MRRARRIFRSILANSDVLLISPVLTGARWRGARLGTDDVASALAEGVRLVDEEKQSCGVGQSAS